MTKEAALETVEETRKWMKTAWGIDAPLEPIIFAINALGQDDVLDKIRAEIMQVANEEKVHDEKWALGLRYAVKIIDKYRKDGKDEKTE